MLLFWSQFLLISIQLTYLATSKRCSIISFNRKVRPLRWRAGQVAGIIFPRSDVKCCSTNDNIDISLTEGAINLHVVDEKDISRGSLLKDIYAVSYRAGSYSRCIWELSK